MSTSSPFGIYKRHIGPSYVQPRFSMGRGLAAVVTTRWSNMNFVDWPMNGLFFLFGCLCPFWPWTSPSWLWLRGLGSWPHSWLGSGTRSWHTHKAMLSYNLCKTCTNGVTSLDYFAHARNLYSAASMGGRLQPVVMRHPPSYLSKLGGGGQLGGVGWRVGGGGGAEG